MFLPASIAQHRYRIGRSLVVLIRQQSPQQRPQAQAQMIIARDDLPVDDIGLPIGQQIHVESGEGEDIGQRALSLSLLFAHSLDRKSTRPNSSHLGMSYP